MNVPILLSLLVGSVLAVMSGALDPLFDLVPPPPPPQMAAAPTPAPKKPHVTEAERSRALAEIEQAMSIIVTKAEYDRVLHGMPLEDVIQVIGAVGQERSSSAIGRRRTVMFSWRNANGSNMNAMFQSGSSDDELRLISKAQFGLP